MDVQIGPQLVEEAPQELRSRLWLALLDNPLLCHTYDEGKVHRHHHQRAGLVNQDMPCRDPCRLCLFTATTYVLSMCSVILPCTHSPAVTASVISIPPVLAVTATTCSQQLGLHAQVEPASRSPLAATRQGPRSSSSFRSHEGFVSVSSASKSSGSQHGLNSLPATTQPASQSSRVQPSSASPTNARDGAKTEDATGTQLSQSSALDISDDSSRVHPDVDDPFKQSLHALHAEQQGSQPHTATAESQRPATHQCSSELQEIGDSQHPTRVTQAPGSGLTPQVPTQAAVQERKAGESSGAASSAASARAASTEAGGDAVNASPVGSASTDAWEMVQDANNIYNWKAGTLFGRSLSSNGRQGSECSEEGESYSQCEHPCK